MTDKKFEIRLSKCIGYMMGRRPDEFGLVPDAEGFVKIKDFLKALTEEEGWRHIRWSHVQQLLINTPHPPVEVDGNRIRAKDRTHIAPPVPVETPPKLLYTCIRPRAYPTVIEKGLSPTAHPYVILSSDRSMAERMGKRHGPTPILLSVHTGKMLTRQVCFLQNGETLFLAERIPPGCFTGPPLPKKDIEAQKPTMPKKEPPQPLAGSFQIDITTVQKGRLIRGTKKEIEWKKERRHRKKEQQRSRGK